MEKDVPALSPVEGLWERFVSWENLVAAAREARRRRRRRPDVAAFERRREEHLARLREELLDGTYRPGPYTAFPVRDPKPRIIHAPAYRDRVVHHALMRVVGPIWDRRFVHHNYACRIGVPAATVRRITVRTAPGSTLPEIFARKPPPH